MDRFSDFKLGIYGVVIKAEKDWRVSGNAFAITTYSSVKVLLLCRI